MNTRLKQFWIRTTHWEYWPMYIAYLPVMLYYLFLSLKARSFGFFAAANPGIPYGGMRGEPKHSILKKLPPGYYPKTLFIVAGTSWEDTQHLFHGSGLSYPIIGKPDVGERGYGIQIIVNAKELAAYHATMQALDFMLQAYIPYKEEYAIYHYRHPAEKEGKIISICKKGFPKVIGDGKKDLKQLIHESPRAFLQWQRLEHELDGQLDYIPAQGEEYPLGHIGNHRLGTEFINAMDEWDERLARVFDQIGEQLDGVCLARYDLRCKSMEDMKEGRHIYIVEINGVGAEMAHIYDRRMSFRERYRDMFWLWSIMYGIARQNHQLGHPYMSIRDLWAWKKGMDAYYPKLLTACAK